MWSEDWAVSFDRWNTYNVIVLPDLNNDDVPDLFLATGGDPIYPEKVRP